MHVAVWDFNGVLADDIEAHRAAFNDILAMFGKPPLRDAAHTRTHTTVPYIDSILAAGIDMAAFKARNIEVDDVYHRTYLAHPAARALRPGVVEALDAVTGRGAHNVILSNTRRDVLLDQLGHWGLTNRFNWMSPCDDRKATGFKLTKSNRLKAYFDDLAHSRVNAVIIGDSTEEPDVARELNLKSIAVSGGWFDTPRLDAANPDYTVASITEAAHILRTIRFAP